ncbi:MAG: SIS domain-containing protein [Candidatus Bathyarchaeia archaeon]
MDEIKILQEIEESRAVKEKLKDQTDIILAMAQDIIRALGNGGKIVFFGNGGSAADAQHLAAELVGRFHKDRISLPAIALTTNTSVMTAVSNDWSFEEIFARQIAALVSEKDLVIGISAGGMSKNALRGMDEAKRKGAKTLALTGKGGGKLATMVDKSIVVPSDNTPRIQEAHITIGHIICGIVEDFVLKDSG